MAGGASVIDDLTGVIRVDEAELLEHQSTPAPPATVHASPPDRGTHIPPKNDAPVGPRRLLRQTTSDEVFNVLGGLAAGMAMSTMLFGWFTPMSGGVGWAVVAFVLFLGIYALLVALRSDRLQVADRIMTVLCYSAGILLLGSLVFVLGYTVVRGLAAIVHPNFFVETMQSAGPLQPLSVGGIAHAIAGTLIQISIALGITIPLGITTAVFLTEIGGKFARFVRTISDAMTALPSIVAGLFVYSAIILLVTHQRSGFAASLAISVMILPIIIRASDVVLRLVAGNLREASYALGASRWRTVWHVVLPTARSGLVTAVILGTARGVGETSPVLLTSGVTSVMNLDPFNGPMISLPLQTFDFVRSPEPNMVARGFGAGATLILLVLVLFAIARVIGGKGPGQLSASSLRRAAARSALDARRIARRAEAAGRVQAASADFPQEANRLQSQPPPPEENPS